MKLQLLRCCLPGVQSNVCLTFACLQGFLPESWDLFAQNVVYKTFSPTVGIFLASSAGYGVWKVSLSELCSFSMASLYQKVCGAILKN